VFTPPAGWTRSGAPHLLTLRPPRGRGRIRCYERLPSLRFLNLVAHVLSLDLGYEEVGRSPVHRAVTAEGEFAAWIELTGRQAGEPAPRCIAAILQDGRAARAGRTAPG
jgi:hypothetical protein